MFLTDIPSWNIVASMKTTVTKIATEVGISQGFLSNILACRRHPQWATALKLAEVLGTDPRFWMKGESAKEERWLALKNAPSTQIKPVLINQNITNSQSKRG